MTDWARKRAEDFHRESCDCPDKSGRKKHGQGAYRRFYCVGCLAAALDAAREEWRKRGEERGAQRERWECHRLARACERERLSQMRTMDDFGRRDCVEAKATEATRIADAISARGPMRWREEGEE